MINSTIESLITPMTDDEQQPNNKRDDELEARRNMNKDTHTCLLLHCCSMWLMLFFIDHPTFLPRCDNTVDCHDSNYNNNKNTNSNANNQTNIGSAIIVVIRRNRFRRTRKAGWLGLNREPAEIDFSELSDDSEERTLEAEVESSTHALALLR